jgi:hypothetical protein
MFPHSRLSSRNGHYERRSLDADSPSWSLSSSYLEAGLDSITELRNHLKTPLNTLHGPFFEVGVPSFDDIDAAAGQEGRSRLVNRPRMPCARFTDATWPSRPVQLYWSRAKSGGIYGGYVMPWLPCYTTWCRDL